AWEMTRLEALSSASSYDDVLIVDYEISVGWNETLRYFNWKVSTNISDIFYNKLHEMLALSGVNVQSLYVTRRFLQLELSLYIENYHRCINNCMVFVG